MFAFLDESQKLQDLHNWIVFLRDFFDFSSWHLGKSGQVEWNDELGDIVAAWIVTSDDDLGTVFRAARIVAFNFSVRNCSLIWNNKVSSYFRGRAELSQSSNSDNQDLKGKSLRMFEKTKLSSNLTINFCILLTFFHNLSTDSTAGKIFSRQLKRNWWNFTYFQAFYTDKILILESLLNKLTKNSTSFIICFKQL